MHVYRNIGNKLVRELHYLTLSKLVFKIQVKELFYYWGLHEGYGIMKSVLSGEKHKEQ